MRLHCYSIFFTPPPHPPLPLTTTLSLPAYRHLPLLRSIHNHLQFHSFGTFYSRFPQNLIQFQQHRHGLLIVFSICSAVVCLCVELESLPGWCLMPGDNEKGVWYKIELTRSIHGWRNIVRKSDFHEPILSRRGRQQAKRQAIRNEGTNQFSIKYKRNSIKNHKYIFLYLVLV